MASENPPRDGEGDRALRGGGGSPSLRRPETYSARRLRREMSPPEVLLWQRIRGRKLGPKFRRQHPIGPYVVDFYCAAAKLVIEIDGLAHDNTDRAARDDRRMRFLEENRLNVLRVTATAVFDDIENVLSAIVVHAENPLHQPAAGPPPRAGEDL